MSRTAGVALVLFLTTAGLGPAAEPDGRVKPLAPREARRSFQALDGFTLQVVACEPNIAEPVVIAYDENGVLYVAEYLKFPSFPVPGKRATGRIRVLRDADRDGKYEQSRVFVDGLEWPTGICPWKGGVFVVAVPDLWYLKDSNGDGRADIQRKIFTGFGFRNEEGTANNLIWGLDGWIYGAGSNSGGEIRPADSPEARPVSLRGRDFRFHPATLKFEAISGSEQFGNTFDDWGNRFICQNSKPVVQVVLPARYLARNPYLPVPTVRRNIWSDGNRVFRISPIESWRLERTKMRLAEERKYSAPSVAHDVFTACSGATVYRGAAYPAEYRGNLFVGDVQSNIVHRRVFKSSGILFDTLRADQQTEMVRSTDNWFRPVNLINAPDGTLHIVDMYREVIETPDSMPPNIIAKIDLLSGNDRGRIYRLAPRGFKIPPPPRLGSATTAQLVDQLENPNGWWRDTAGRLLVERQDREAVALLKALVAQTKSSIARLHALYVLDGLQALTSAELSIGLEDGSPELREHAVRLAEGYLRDDPRLLAKVIDLVGDEHPRVRFQVAFSLGETDDPKAARALAKIAKRDARDVWIRTAVLSSSLNLAGGMLESLLEDEEFAANGAGQALLRQLALVVGGRNRSTEVLAVLRLLDTTSAGHRAEVARAITLGLGEGLQRAGSSLGRYADKSPAAQKLLASLIDRATKTLDGSGATARQQVAAIEMLAHGKFEAVCESLGAMLDSRYAPSVQMAAIHALGRFDTPDVAEELIDAWDRLSPAVRGEVVEVLLGRPTWTNSLLGAIEEGSVAPGYIAPVRKERLVKHPNVEIGRRARALFGSAAPSPRKDVVDQYRAALRLKGDADRGKKVFEENCVTCHKVGSRGHEVGPNLATIQNRTPEALMIQILDPNREVLANYTQYAVLLESGRVVSGLIASESPNSLTIRRAEGVEETVLRQNIEQIVGTGKSLMPEGLEQKIDQQQMRDLLEFLLGVKQP